jgi:hypothetical protein
MKKVRKSVSIEAVDKTVKEVKEDAEDVDEDDNESEEEDEGEVSDKEVDTTKKTDNQNKNQNDKKSMKNTMHDHESVKEEPPIEELRIDGMLTVMTEAAGGKFGNAKQYYARFFFEGQFLAFFTSQDVKLIPVFFIKVKYILSIEDFFNTNPTQVYVEYFDGKKESRIVLMIPEIKIKDKWIDTMSSLKDELEDVDDKNYEDFGKSEVEMKYQITAEYESEIKRNTTPDKACSIQFR